MLQIVGVPEGFVVDVALPANSSFSIKGLKDDLLELQPAELLGVVDFEQYMSDMGMEALVEGTYSVEAEFALDSAYTLVEPVMVDIVISVPMEAEASVDI